MPRSPLALCGWQRQVVYWARSEAEDRGWLDRFIDSGFAVGNIVGYLSAVEDYRPRYWKWPWRDSKPSYARQAIGAAGVESFLAAATKDRAERVAA